MAIVPEFLIKRIYQKGSLGVNNQNGTPETFLTLKNVLGPGLISGFNFVKINDIIFEAKDVKFITNGKEYLGTEVTEENPVVFRLGQSGKLIMSGKECITAGKNLIEIEAVNPEAGIVQLKTEDFV